MCDTVPLSWLWIAGESTLKLFLKLATELVDLTAQDRFQAWGGRRGGGGGGGVAPFILQIFVSSSPSTERMEEKHAQQGGEMQGGGAWDLI